ncbi:MAG: iron uptake porin [Halothece sp.]
MVAQAGPVFAQSAGSSEQDVLQQIEDYNNQGDSNSVGEINQVNSVFQLEDVSPDDWAFEALRNLVERYGCIAGYPDGTFRGDESMTRYEFAAGLNACLQQIEQLIASQESDVSQEDLESLQRLTEEFEAELATLGTRVDNLEGRVGTLEDNQFSTTTKLSGEVVFMNPIAFGGNDDDEGGPQATEKLGFGYDAVLDLKASFTGRDSLKVSLQAADFGDFENGGATTGDAALDNGENTEGEFVLEDLIYSFPLGEKVQVDIGVNDFDPDSAFSYSYGSGATFSDFTIDGEEAITDGTGAEDDVGVSTNIDLTDKLSFGVGYTTNSDNATDANVGLFEDFSLSSGLNYAGDNFDVGLAYNLTETIGDETLVGAERFTEATQNSVGARGAVRLGSRTEIGGFVEYIDFDLDDPVTDDEFGSDGWSFGTNVAFFDIGKEGSTLGVAFASRAFFDEGELNGVESPLQDDRTYLAEVFYDFPVNDNISITPGLTAIFNPENDSDNDEVYVGVVRTTFSF